MKRVTPWVLCATLAWSSIAAQQAYAAPTASAPKSKLGAPAKERRVDSGVDLNQLRRVDERARNHATQPSSELEARHYFRFRPDTLGHTARAKEQALLAELLADREQKVKARRAEAIALLDAFVAQEPEDASEMADALLRLSELHWELARIDYLEAFGRYQNLPDNRRPARPPLPNFERAFALYDRLLEKHPNFSRLDLVLYMKAYTLVERGDYEASLPLFRRLLLEYKESRFRPDAHMALAEYVFNTDYDYKAALTEYDQVLKYEESELFDLALFKSAWCLWQLGRRTDAAVRFRKVLDLEGERSALRRKTRIKELQSEALEYLIQVFTEDERNRAADVRRFLQEIGGEKHVERVLIRLSATYFDQARFDQGIESYGLLLQITPAGKHAPSYQLAIARGQLAMGNFPKARDAFAVLAETYARNSTWASQQPDPDTVLEAHALIERALREQALSLHEIGQRDTRREDFERAVAIYQIYLQHFDDAEESYRLRFYLGEILFHRLERHAEAGEAYMLAARKQPQGEFTKDALYNAIGAFERVREKEIGRCPASSNTPCPETENDQKFAAAIELYASYFPNDPDLPEILFRQGKFYYERHIYDPAVRMFGQLLDRFPDSAYAGNAGELVLDSFNRAADYQNIELWARKLKGAPAFKSPDSQARLNGLILGAVFKIGEQLAAQKEHTQAADAFIRAAQEFPADPRAPKAYYNAGLELTRAGLLSRADTTYSTLIEKHPNTDEGALGAWNGAQMYESIAQFRDAARFYEAYASRFPKAPKAADAAYNAVLLRLSARDYKLASSNGKRFTEHFPKDAAVDDVYFLIGRAQEAEAAYGAAEATYREYLRRTKNVDRRVEAYTRLGQVLTSAGQKKAADTAYSEAVSEGRKHRKTLKEGRHYAAQARFLQGDQALADFDDVRIEGDIKGLSTRLKLKAKLLAKAATIYGEVVEFEVAEWVTAALYKIGHSYELFAKALGEAPLPPGLSEDEQQVYRDELAMFVIPIEERALQAYEGGYKRARELGIYNQWTVHMRAGLTRMNEVEYPPLREMGGQIVREALLAEGPVLEGLRDRSAPANANAGAGTASPAKPKKNTKSPHPSSPGKTNRTPSNAKGASS